MICIIMAGGKGSRLGLIEKPLIKVCGEPIIEKIINVLSSICDSIYVAISPHTLRTKAWCLKNNVKIVETTGKNYVHDLQEILRNFRKPLLILPCDIPFITVDTLLEFIEKARETKSNVITLLVNKRCFPSKLRKKDTEAIGISLFKSDGATWSNVVMCKFPELFDIDTFNDLKYVRELC